MENVSRGRDGLMLKPHHISYGGAWPDGPIRATIQGWDVDRKADKAALHSPPPTIAIVDDDPAVLRSLARLLAVHGYQVRAFASSEALLAEIELFGPDCVIADLSMPGLSGLDLQHRLDELGLRYPMVFVTGHGDIQASVLAMRGGAVDFLTKPYDQNHLLDAVERALSRTRLSRAESERLASAKRRVASLTEREREVFHQVAAGLLNKQIAANLGISEKTVKVHRARMMRKMAVRSVAQLARVAEQIGADGAGPSTPVI
jgi:FixJ family two-component response regulator